MQLIVLCKAGQLDSLGLNMQQAEAIAFLTRFSWIKYATPLTNSL